MRIRVCEQCRSAQKAEAGEGEWKQRTPDLETPEYEAEGILGGLRLGRVWGVLAFCIRASVTTPHV